MERLTTKELAPYLPYDLTVMGNINGIDTECCLTTWNIESHIQAQSKPLLRSLSSIDLKWFQDNIDEALEDFIINCEPEKNHFSVEVCDKVLGWSALSLEEYQLFYRDHVDIHGLIDLDLALPIEGKEVEGE